MSVHQGTQDVLTELRRLEATNIVVSTNVEIRQDGLPYSNRRTPDDPGAAVYFILDGKEQCIPCDKWGRVGDNLRAIAKTIEALRGIERWGAKEMVNAAFRGFESLPDPGSVSIGIPQYFADCVDADHARSRFKRLAKELHPDMGGKAEEFTEMERQYKSLSWSSGK